MARILIVDDALFTRRNLSAIFKKEGFEIAGEAVNGKEAIEKFKELTPDLVTMDVIMPEVGGINAITAVKEIMKINPQAKIVIISAMGQHSFVMDTIHAGAKDYIVKPYLASEVAERVKRVLKGDI